LPALRLGFRFKQFSAKQAELMNKGSVRAASCFAATIVLSGCVQAATNSARKEAQLQCERDGKVFVEREKISSGGMFGSVTVAGDCLGPDDEGYAEAVEKQKAKGASVR
jgi:cytoskeletal protein CcmA (bactofilin family)